MDPVAAFDAALAAVGANAAEAAAQQRARVGGDGARTDPWASAPAEPFEGESGTLEADLRAFIADRRVWPTVDHFLDAGEGELLHRVYRTGGPSYWQERLGVTRSWLGASAKGAWNPESALRAIKHFVEGRATWPTRAEILSAHMQAALALARGPMSNDAFADSLGLTRLKSMHWDDEAIHRELSAFIGDRTNWPTQREFRAAGYKGLLDAIYNHGGAKHWAEQFGMTPRPSGRKTKP